MARGRHALAIVCDVTVFGMCAYLMAAVEHRRGACRAAVTCVTFKLSCRTAPRYVPFVFLPFPCLRTISHGNYGKNRAVPSSLRARVCVRGSLCLLSCSCGCLLCGSFFLGVRSPLGISTFVFIVIRGGLRRAWLESETCVLYVYTVPFPPPLLTASFQPITLRRVCALRRCSGSCCFWNIPSAGHSVCLR